MVSGVPTATDDMMLLYGLLLLMEETDTESESYSKAHSQ